MAAKTSGSRQPYSSPLRQRQQELTRERILEACLSLIVEGRLASFSIRDVATRADVSYASVYRHFPTRDDILDQVYAWADEHIGKWGEEPRLLSELPESTRRKLEKFEEHFEMVSGFAVALAALKVEPARRRRRDDHLRGLLTTAAPRLTPGRARELAALISHTTSALTWSILRTRFGLSREQAANTILWSLDYLIAAATGKGRSR